MVLCVALPEKVMKICLSQISKRYRNHWIFRNVTYTFEAGKIYALLGANGSGKSTLMRIIGTIQQTNNGTIDYWSHDKKLLPENVLEYVSYCAPGMELIEEMTLNEFLKFHFSFKKIIHGYTIESIIETLQFTNARHKQLSEFSSGMLQRVKLAQAFFSDTSIVLLDEPCSNLDTNGVELYQKFLKNFSKNRIVIIASNDEKEFEQAQHFLSLSDYH